MLRSPWSRSVAIALLLAGLVGLGVWYGSLAPAPGVGDYPGGESLAADYDGHVGERVEIAALAVETDPLVVAVEGVRLRIAGLDRPVEVGDMVWVYGVVQPTEAGDDATGADGHVRATDAVVISPGEFRYGRTISLLAGLWVLGRILRDWRLDREAWGLAPDPTGSWPGLGSSVLPFGAPDEVDRTTEGDSPDA